MAKKPKKRWVESGPLPRWMRLYVLWLTGRGGELSGSRGAYRARFPTAKERAAKASELSGRAVQERVVMVLEKRKDIREYFDKLQADSQFLAKELASQRVTRNFEARDRALDGAEAKEDFRAVETITRPYVEYGMPKKVERENQPQRVVINLIGASEEQKRLVLSALSDEPEPEIEFEVIPNDKLLESGDE